MSRKLARWASKYRRRHNPLKDSAFESRLPALKELGISEEVINDLKNNFNGPHNHPSHVIYTMDWLRARAALQKFYEELEATGRVSDKIMSIVSKYVYTYKLDPYRFTFDDELQQDHYDTLKHYAQMAETNPYFRKAWPTLYQVTYDQPPDYEWGQPRRTTILGEVREMNSQMHPTHPAVRARKAVAGEPAITILTGANRAISDTQVTRIPKSWIISMEESSGPHSLLAFLKDMEQNIKTERYFVPAVHEPFLTFPDGKAWVIIDSKDIHKEASSLGDCGRAENPQTFLISLREPVSPTHWQALLKGEIVVNCPTSRSTTIDSIKDAVGVIVQLRMARNSKPDPVFHPYIMALLKQPWIHHLVRPNFSPDGTFYLEDLVHTPKGKEELDKLLRAKPYLDNTQQFYDKFKKELRGFPSNIREKIVEDIEYSPQQIIENFTIPRLHPTERRQALKVFKRRLQNGRKYLRQRTFAALRDLLLRTKDKALIKEILGVLGGHKTGGKFLIALIEAKEDWLLANQVFFIEILGSYLPTDSSSGYYRSKKLLFPSFYRYLSGLLAASPENPKDRAAAELVLRLLFSVSFSTSGSSGRFLRRLTEEFLQVLIDHPEYLTHDLCRWYQQEPGGWGSHHHRSYNNSTPYSPRLQQLLGRLMDVSVARSDDCYLDLALTIAGQVEAGGKKSQFRRAMIKHLYKILTCDNRSLRNAAYKALSNLVD